MDVLFQFTFKPLKSIIIIKNVKKQDVKNKKFVHTSTKTTTYTMNNNEMMKARMNFAIFAFFVKSKISSLSYNL
jgi:hypothetical protein